MAGSLGGLFDRYGLGAAVLIGLITRLLLIQIVFHWDNISVPFGSDDTTYVAIAKEILEAGRLTTHHFPVGYPIFLAPFFELGDASFAAIRIAQVFLGVLTIVCVSRIASLLYGNRAGVIAAWLTALYPPLVYMTGRIMSETLFIALLMLSLYQFLLSDRDQSVRKSAWAAALFGLASIVRSNLVLMVGLLPLWSLARPGASWRKRILNGAICAAVSGAILLIPGLYFLSTKGEFIPFATNSGQTFYGANNPLADGGWVQVEDHPELLATIPPSIRISPSAYSKAQRDLGLKWIYENPAAFAHLLPRKFANAWLPGFQNSETTSRSGLAAAVLAMAYAALLIGAIAGRLIFRPVQRDGVLLIVLATYMVMSLTFYGNPRIGLFCAPVLIVYAAACLAHILPKSGQQFSSLFSIGRLSPLHRRNT